MSTLHIHAGDGLTVEAVADLLRRLTDDEFGERFGAFALLVAEGDRKTSTGPGTREVSESTTGEHGPARYRVFPVRKVPGVNNMRHVTVGRTRNNDVWIDDKTLSKFHAYFLIDDDGPRVHDGGSANSTHLNGELVPVPGAGEPPLLGSPDALRLGGLETTFVTLADLRVFIDRLRELDS